MKRASAKEVNTIMAATMPIANPLAMGIIRAGFSTSSPAIEMASNPMKEKKPVAAPAITPPNPNGINPSGCVKLSGFA